MPRLPHCALILTALALTASSCRAQTVEATTAPTGQPQYTLRTRVPITILDIVVTDGKGHPVHGLKQSDFTILEDKQPMTPKTFEEHRSDEAPAAPPPPPAKLPPNTFANTAPAAGAADRPANILLIDALNTPTQVQQIVHRQMVAFLAKMPPGTTMAVLHLGSRLSLVQGFTSDRDLLRAAIDDKRFMAQKPMLEDLGQEPPGIDDPFPETPEVTCNKAAQRAETSLSGMRQLALFLGGIPGRKNLIWFSGSYQMQMGLHAADDCYNLTAPLTSATDALARAHVAIYPIDPRALDALADPRNHGFDSKILDKQRNEHLTMEAMAEQTGGKAVYTSNDLAGAVQQAVDDGANFYSLTYTPTNQTLDTRFRTIKVTVDQPGLHLLYRPGYYASDPGTSLSGAKVPPRATPLETALIRGAIEPTQILFTVQASVADLPPEAEYDLKVHPKGSTTLYRRYTLVYNFAIDNIVFDASLAGDYRAHFDFNVVAYDGDGKVVDSATKEVWPRISPANYRAMLQAGGNAHQDIDLPAKGDFTLRLAVHDAASGHVGALEIPVASIHGE